MRTKRREIYFLFHSNVDELTGKEGGSGESRLTRKIGAMKFRQIQIGKRERWRKLARFECFGIWFDLSLGISDVTCKNEVPLLATRKRMQNPQTARCPEWWMKRYSGNNVHTRERPSTHDYSHRERWVTILCRLSGACPKISSVKSNCLNIVEKYVNFIIQMTY